jgi:hypothetical protein
MRARGRTSQAAWAWARENSSNSRPASSRIQVSGPVRHFPCAAGRRFGKGGDGDAVVLMQADSGMHETT